MDLTLEGRLRNDAILRTQHIERVAMRILTMETSYLHLHKCHPQRQSKLFSKIPPEIRLMIFEAATAQYEDLRHKYKEYSFHWRPGHRAPRKTWTKILLTCRLVWLEASHMPRQEAELTFWPGENRGPLHAMTPHNLCRAIFSPSQRGWTRLNKENFRTLHILAQEHEIEDFFRPQPALTQILQHLTPKILRITMRHTDWPGWEDAFPLALNSPWISSIIDADYMPSIERLELELETLEQYKDQLDVILDSIKSIQGLPARLPSNLATCRHLTPKGEPRFWHWTGPVNVGGRVEEAHEGLELLEYRVAVLTWEARYSDTPTSLPWHYRPAPCDRHPPLMLPHHMRVPSTGAHPWLSGDRNKLRGAAFYSSRSHEDGSIRNDQRSNLDEMRLTQYTTERLSAEIAGDTEDYRRWLFHKAYAPSKANEYLQKWQAANSLLKFEEE